MTTPFLVFNVTDYGAIADPHIDNTPMIQAAIDAAAAAGGGTVVIPPGTLGVAAPAGEPGAIYLRSNVDLQGSGLGVDGHEGDVTGIVRTQWGVESSNITVSNLTIDGNQANTTGQVDGLFTGPEPGSDLIDSDITFDQIEITQVSRYAFDPHETTVNLTITNSVAHHNGRDGFVLDRIVSGEISGNVSYENGRHGFNVVTTSEDLVFRDNVAHDNGGAGFVVQRGSELIESPSGITFEGGASFGNGREGVLIQFSTDVEISGMEIYENGMQGIRIYGSSQVTVRDNTVHDNSQSRDGGFSEIEVQDYPGSGPNDPAYYATGNVIAGNTISATGDIRASYGIEIQSVGTVEIANNTIEGALNGARLVHLDPTTLVEADAAGGYARGTEGDDIILAASGDSELVGKAGEDQLVGGNGNDLLSGGADDDMLFGDNPLAPPPYGDAISHDQLDGGSGNDLLYGGFGNDELRGGSGDDLIFDGSGDDTVSGGRGNDTVIAGTGSDHYSGNSGHDLLSYATMSEGIGLNLSLKTATSGDVNDTFSSFESFEATVHDDRVRGSDRAEIVSAGAGNDVIRSAGGADTLSGGEGDDVFQYRQRDVVDQNGNHRGTDIITDFELGDTIDLSGIAESDFSNVSLRQGQNGLLLSATIDGQARDIVELCGLSDASLVTLAASDAIMS